MQKYDSNQYVEIFQKLPPELKDVVSSDDTINKITLIGKKHRLQIDQIGNLVDITFDVLMGITATKNFAKEISDNLNMSVLGASAITHDIDEDIFQPIKKIMMAIYNDGAPNKPGSSLVQFYEEDEDHEHLSADHILNEIENPTASIVKKETITTQVINPPTKMAEPFQTAPEKIEAPIVPKPAEVIAPKAEIKKEVKKIDDIQLDKVFIMPKEGAVPQSSLNAIKLDLSSAYAKDKSLDVPPLRPDPKIQTPATKKIEAKPTPKIESAPLPPSQTGSVDPYREKI